MLLKLFPVLLLLCLIGTACNPVKRLQKQDKAIAALKAQWAAEYALKNPCPQLPVINLDSLCEQIGYVYGDVLFDTTQQKTDSAKAASVPESSKPTPQPCKPKNILVPGPPDERMIRLLNDSLAAVRMQLAYCTGKQTGIKEVVVKQSDWKWNKWTSLFIALLLLNLLVIAFLIFRKR